MTNVFVPMNVPGRLMFLAIVDTTLNQLNHFLKLEKYKEITVIIPAIDFNNYLINCIEKIYDISKSINVTVLLDKYCEEIEHYKKKFLNLKFYVHND